MTAPRSPFTSAGPRVQAVGKVVRAGVGRRRVQTTVMILTVLVAALVLAFLVWIPVEIWGQKEADDVAPQQPGQQMQSQVPAAPPQNAGTAPAQPAAPAQ